MAKLVLSLGTSHTPLLTFGARAWSEYAKRDLKNQRLNLSDGSYMSYDALLTKVGGRYADVATLDRFLTAEAACHGALDRLATALDDARPDVAVVITDDESELFSRANTPAIAVYYGEKLVMRPFSAKQIDLDAPPPFFDEMIRGYAMDMPHEFPAAPLFARDLIERLIDAGIDIGAADTVVDPATAGLGHGIGFVIRRLLARRPIPITPVLLNTYYPPNQPTPGRCVEIGRALRRAVEACGPDLRVALIASGGLSHFVVDEALDQTIIAALRAGDPARLAAIPKGALNAGSSEIRNWIALAGAVNGVAPEWLEYQPLYRTPAGTGVGTAFGVWRP
ncbi:MAG: extradiol ring-cleavage dioxygenase [Alphaproteobacteria bacterium]|nr:extradiol ring-cleavage dioxygenase [Alphaproteobacteria bacterium]